MRAIESQWNTRRRVRSRAYRALTPARWSLCARSASMWFRPPTCFSTPRSAGTASSSSRISRRRMRWGHRAAGVPAHRRHHRRSPTEHDIAEFIRQRFIEEGMVVTDGPVVAANAHAADPHFEPTEENTSVIRRGDWVLIDLWTRQPHEDAMFADITWTAVCRRKPDSAPPPGLRRGNRRTRCRSGAAGASARRGQDA